MEKVNQSAVEAKKVINAGKIRRNDLSILTPVGSELKIIFNPCNIEGKFDTDLHKLLSKRWTKPKDEYKMWFVTRQNFKLNESIMASVQSDVWVYNTLLFKEDKFQGDLNKVLKDLATKAKYDKGSVHISDLVFDQLPELNEEMLKKHLLDEGVNVFLYKDKK